MICGILMYIYEGNWKLIVENGVDGYYVGIVYWNYLLMMSYCNYEDGGIEVVDVKSWLGEGGFYFFENGYMMLWICLINLVVCFIYN